MFRRATLAAGLLGAVVFGMSQASAATIATYNVTDAGGFFSNIVAHGPNETNTDTIVINLVGPGQVASPGNAGIVSLNFVGTSFSAFSYQWIGPSNSPNQSGALDLSNLNTIQLPFTGTTPAGEPASYQLILTSATSGPGGGAYNYNIQIDACTRGAGCAPPPVPVPPAAVLFVSGLAGLGLLGRRRRKNARELTAV